MRGRKPKPSALKRAQGNPGGRKLNTTEPAFSGTPTCPNWLNVIARAEWDRVVQELSALNMVCGVDSASLASYCQSYSRWQTAEQIVDCEGQTVQEPIVSKAGEIVGHKTKSHPATVIAKDAQAAMLRSAALFGFDPSSRSRLSVGDGAQKDPFTEFMNGRSPMRKQSKAKQYISDVLAGRVLTSKLVKLTIERHARDLESAPERGYHFSRIRAQRVIDFVERFTCHSKGEFAGKPFLLDPWQQAFLWILFGWIHAGTGYRRFRFSYAEIARGNGKSTLAAAVALYMMVADGEGGAECNTRRE
jgi:P27 family predicted phage terminase small subunit